MPRGIIAGGGIFGITAAVELSARGFDVTLLDPGPIPHPDASSTDISKVLRMDYGGDLFYMEWMEEAFAGWDSWNEKWGEALYHQTGVLNLSRSPMQPGEYEYESFQLLNSRGHAVERMDPGMLEQRFPAWNANLYPDGYFNPRGGWVESGRVVEGLLAEFTARGGQVLQGQRVMSLLVEGSRAVGFHTQRGDKLHGDFCILAAGAWTPALHPDLKDVMWPTAQDVLHFRTDHVRKFSAPEFPVFTADVSRSGWYGFPAMPDGTIKIANHGEGRQMDPSGPRKVGLQTEAKFRRFFKDTFPDLVSAKKIYERVCFYADTFDGDFWIGEDPVRDGLFVASGGSGHAFKFAPVLGPLIADVVERKENPAAERFAWRARGQRKKEFARFEGADRWEQFQ